MDVQYFKELLHDRGLKATPTRISLLTRMHEYQAAMPYSEIQEVLNDIDRVTLYRTLESLKEQGIIHTAYHENKETYFAICGNKCGEDHHYHDHLHFLCTSCNTVSCVKPDNAVQISIAGNEIRKISIHIEGICKACKEKRVR